MAVNAGSNMVMTVIWPLSPEKRIGIHGHHGVSVYLRFYPKFALRQSSGVWGEEHGSLQSGQYAQGCFDQFADYRTHMPNQSNNELFFP